MDILQKGARGKADVKKDSSRLKKYKISLEESLVKSINWFKQSFSYNIDNSSKSGE